MKHIPRFYSTDLKIKGKEISFSDNYVYKKMHNVLRMQKDDLAIITDGLGNTYQVSLEIISTQSITGRIKNKLTSEVTPKYKLTLAQALPKGNALDNIIRMGTEIGVNEFLFFESKYSIVKKKNFKQNKIDRLNKIIIEASLQSERGLFPTILAPVTYKEALSQTKRKILLHSRTVDQSQDLNIIKSGLEDNEDLIIIIGPEGGFSQEEIHEAIAEGCLIAHINLPVLKTSTAAAVASGIILS